MKTKLCVCKKCKKLPELMIMPGDLYYIKCTCNRWGPYDFLGLTPESAAQSWNEFNG